MSDSKKVDAYIMKHEQWSDVFSILREILLSTGLEETVKWGTPTYTLDGKNIVGLAGFKNHCAAWFHQGSFLKDKSKCLVNAGEGRTKGLRQWRFQAGDKVQSRLFKAYVLEAIENHKAGKAIKPEKKTLVVPDELAAALKSNSKLRKGFDSLTPGKQREYADHIGSAKQEKTRLSRLEKASPMIVQGVGLHERYRNC